MNLIEYLCALGLMMICFAFLYRNRTKHYREYVSRQRSFTIEIPKSEALIFDPPLPEDGLKPGDKIRFAGIVSPIKTGFGEPKPLDPNWKP